MADRTPPTRAQAEAADWLARFGNRSVTTKELRDFRDWRDDPANDAAYEDAETFWETSRRQANDPEVLKMTEAAFSRQRGLRLPTWIRTPVFAWGFALAGAATVAAVVLAINLAFPTYTTNGTEQRVVLLKDGSRVHLNVGSQVKVAFTPNERRLFLSRGEAFFDVAHDTQRPFIVQADGAGVRAVGTKFDVRREPGQLQVTLVEGVVRVQRNSSADTWTLTPNQQLILSGDKAVKRASTDALRTTSWTTGRLIFNKTPLAAAVAEVNRYSDRKIELDGPDVGDRLLDGAFNIGDTDAFVKGVSMVLNLEATTDPNGAVHLHALPGSPGV